jgi:type VI secretion system secreted protein VgrG
MTARCRYFNGYVFEFRFIRNDAGFSFYAMVLRLWLAFLNYRQDNALFHSQTVEAQTAALFDRYEQRD